MSRRTTLALVGVVAVLLVGGFLWKYGGSTDGVEKTDGEITLGWREVDGIPLDASAAELPVIGGAQVGLPTRGTYLLNLWYSTCAPCKEEMPWLAQLAQGGQVAVVGVTRDTIEQSAIDLMTETGVDYPNFWDPEADFWYSLSEVAPTKVAPNSLIVQDGKVTWVHVGPFESYDDLVEGVVPRTTGQG